MVATTLKQIEARSLEVPKTLEDFMNKPLKLYYFMRPSNTAVEAAIPTGVWDGCNLYFTNHTPEFTTDVIVVTTTVENGDHVDALSMTLPFDKGTILLGVLMEEDFVG